MNGAVSDNAFTPKRALAPTAALYDELVNDGMSNLAEATVTHMPRTFDEVLVQDNGCGPGAATSAIVKVLGRSSDALRIKATDIDDGAVELYRKLAAERGWPAEVQKMDSRKLTFSDDYFTASVSNALLIVMPDDAAAKVVKETYRTLRPGGVAAFNSWSFVPNYPPLMAAAKKTQPEGTAPLRLDLSKWGKPEHICGIIEDGGFASDKVVLKEGDVFATTVELKRYAHMLWSFIGGTGPAGWLRQGEETWDQALEIILEELKKTDGYEPLDGNRAKLKFKAIIALATK